VTGKLVVKPKTQDGYFLLSFAFLSLVTRHLLLIMVQAHAFVYGRVQGVNFRFYVQRKAVELGLNGYVRNLHDGRVEIVAQGLQENVHRLLDYVRGNPGLSQVVKLDIDWEESLGSLSGFHVRF
jgi:acylphosphatase